MNREKSSRADNRVRADRCQAELISAEEIVSWVPSALPLNRTLIGMSLSDPGFHHGGMWLLVMMLLGITSTYCSSRGKLFKEFWIERPVLVEKSMIKGQF